MSDELDEKIGRMNSAAIRQSLQGMEQKLQEVQDTVRAGQNTIGALMNRVIQLEQQLNVMRAMSRGTGPSSN